MDLKKLTNLLKSEKKVNDSTQITLNVGTNTK